MQMSYLYESDFPFKNFFRLNQHAEAIKQQCLGKEKWRELVSDKSIDHDKPHCDFFFTTISTSKKMFLFGARAEKGIVWHIDASSVDS